MNAKRKLNRHDSFARILAVSTFIGLLVVAAVAVAGLGSPKPPTVESGINATCSISPPSTSCVITITFPSPFLSKPVVSVILQSNVLAYLYPGLSVSILATEPAATWVGGMPAAQTELFSNSDHEALVDLSGIQAFTWSVLCPASSSQVGAFLELQFSLDQGATWTELGQFGTGRIFVDGASNPASQGNCPALSSSQINTVAVTAAKTLVILRVVGVGGGGVLDTPTFSQITLQTQTQHFEYFWGIQPITKTGFKINVQTDIPPVTLSSVFAPDFNWYATTA